MGVPGGRPIRGLLTGQLRVGRSGVLLASMVRKDAEFPGLDDGADALCGASAEHGTTTVRCVGVLLPTLWKAELPLIQPMAMN